jgi:hypothetical protein
MRKKFAIFYPVNHHDPDKAGKKYKPSKGKTIAMTNGGIFLLLSSDGFYMYCEGLSEVIGNYDVVWQEEE